MQRKNKTEDNIFKQVNTEIEGQIEGIKKIADPAEQLAQYESLKKSFNSLFGGGSKLQKAFNDVDKDKPLGGAFLGGYMGFWASFIPLVIAFPPALPAVAAVTASAAFIGRHLGYRIVAKEARLTLRDVKYAVKTKKLERKVAGAVGSLSRKIKKAALDIEKAAVAAEKKNFSQKFKTNTPAAPGL